VLCHFHWPIFK